MRRRLDMACPALEVRTRSLTAKVIARLEEWLTA